MAAIIVQPLATPDSMKVLLIALMLSHPYSGGKKDSVFLCDSPGAKRYHLSATCRGLSNCTYRTIKLPVDKVRKNGKTLCKWEN